MQQRSPGPTASLTAREQQVLELIQAGLGNRAISAQLGISHDTARRYSSRVKRKLGARSTFALPCRSGCLGPDAYWQLALHAFGLSAAETRILYFLSQELSSKAIARQLSLSPRTIDKHRQNLLRKLGVPSLRMLIAWLARQYAKCGIAKSSDKY